MDALEPAVITTLIEDAVCDLRDEHAWQEAVDREDAEKKQLAACADRWDDVLDLVGEE